MKTISIRALSIGALALLTFAGAAAAQTDPSAVLNSLQVQDLVKRADPADHARLGAHFAALADRYTAEANEHATMAQAYRGGRIAQAAAHCDRLIALSRDSAKEATAAAAMHKDLAGVAR